MNRSGNAAVAEGVAVAVAVAGTANVGTAAAAVVMVGPRDRTTALANWLERATAVHPFRLLVRLDPGRSERRALRCA